MGEDFGRLQTALSGHYTVERELGRGGMATVYLADDTRNHRRVAVKVLDSDYASVVARGRFLREIEIAATLAHPGIIPLFDSGVSEDVVYYVMPYVEGETLRDFLDREVQLPMDTVLRIAREVAEALAYAHARGVIHRDIKPANILLTEGHAQVADFGIARAVWAATGEQSTAKGIAVGTPQYMSPEQWAAGVVDRRTDVWALGCVVYEMLAGTPPFTGATPDAIRARVQSEAPPALEVVRPGVGHAVQAVVERALAKVPADRWQSASEFEEALEAAAKAPESAPYLPARRHARRRLLVAVGGALGLAAALAIWRPWAPGVPVDANKVMGFPLRVQGSATRADAEVVMQGIGNALIHTEPLKWLDPWGVVDPALRENPGIVSAAAVRRLARKYGARFYVTGVLAQAADSQTVTLELYDARADSLVGREVAGGVESAGVLGLRAVNALLPKLVGHSTHVDEAWLNPRRPAAVVNWLEGEVAYRHARYDDAMGFYRRALAEDSELVVAALKGAMTAAWLMEYPTGDSLVNVALRHVGDLPQRNARMARGLHFFFQGDGDSALAWFRGALDADPGWSEGWYGVGEAYLHLIPSGTGLDSLAEDAFARSVLADSAFSPPLKHLAETALGRGDLRAGRRWTALFSRASEDPVARDKLERMTRCVEDGPSAADWPGVVRQGHADIALDVARLFSAGMRQPECALAAFEAAAHGDGVERAIRWSALKGVFFVTLAGGDTARAAAFADSMVATGEPTMLPLHILGGMLGVVSEAKALAGLAPYQLRLDSMAPGRLSFFTAWFAQHGDRARVDSVYRIAASRADTSAVWRSWADALSGRLAMMRGDTGEALRCLTRLRPVADVGSLAWGPFDSRPTERMLLARLLMARARVEEALRIAGEFDRAILINVAYLRESLELRARAAELLGRSRVAAGYRERLARLTNGR